MRPGRDADHSHPYVVLKSAVSRSYTISPPGACMAVAVHFYFTYRFYIVTYLLSRFVEIIHFLSNAQVSIEMQQLPVYEVSNSLASAEWAFFSHYSCVVTVHCIMLGSQATDTLQHEQLL